MIEALPPPYRSSKESIDSPYDPHFPTHIPFETSYRFSSRLRRLLQQRSSSRGVYLTLHIPHSLNNCKLISIESASTCSSSSSLSSASSTSSNSSDDAASISTADTDLDTLSEKMPEMMMMDGISENLIHYTTLNNSTYEKMPLLIGDVDRIPFFDDPEAGAAVAAKPKQSALKSAISKSSKKKSKRVKFKKDPRYRHRDRHAYGYIGHIDEEKETSYLTFFLLLLLVFTMVCAAGVFIAWALGFAGGKAATSGAGVVAAAAGGLAGGANGVKAPPPAVHIPIVHAAHPGVAPGVSVQNGGVVKRAGEAKAGVQKRYIDVGPSDTIAVIAKKKRYIDIAPGDTLAVVEKRNSRVWRHQVKREAAPAPPPAQKKDWRLRRSTEKEEYVQATDLLF
ncbi:hypothetical protein H072_10210 [Dactylellina haptotyla CBS 200.50]|uniref:Uncharacterized protein n=1 Tax=Dactylellina haptotyla (strain CBS 200.50) TaxID=1284197 RepID=S8A0T7_DACHA|nr:hypothetical protein H072_10210 [Dactylellina haptotyla CBS 200.50]